MAHYHVFLAVSLTINAALAGYKRKISSSKRLSTVEAPEVESARQQIEDNERDLDWSEVTTQAWPLIARQYLSVYALAAGADWMQVRHQTEQDVQVSTSDHNQGLVHLCTLQAPIPASQVHGRSAVLNRIRLWCVVRHLCGISGGSLWSQKSLPGVLRSLFPLECLHDGQSSSFSVYWKSIGWGQHNLAVQCLRGVDDWQSIYARR